jgi:hypothetical protein
VLRSTEQVYARTLFFGCAAPLVGVVTDVATEVSCRTGKLDNIVYSTVSLLVDEEGMCTEESCPIKSTILANCILYHMSSHDVCCKRKKSHLLKPFAGFASSRTRTASYCCHGNRVSRLWTWLAPSVCCFELGNDIL